jgi:hypothetical protein
LYGIVPLPDSKKVRDQICFGFAAELFIPFPHPHYSDTLIKLPYFVNTGLLTAKYRGKWDPHNNAVFLRKNTYRRDTESKLAIAVNPAETGFYPFATTEQIMKDRSVSFIL